MWEIDIKYFVLVYFGILFFCLLFTWGIQCLFLILNSVINKNRKGVYKIIQIKDVEHFDSSPINYRYPKIFHGYKITARSMDKDETNLENKELFISDIIDVNLKDYIEKNGFEKFGVDIYTNKLSGDSFIAANAKKLLIRESLKYCTKNMTNKEIWQKVCKDRKNRWISLCLEFLFQPLILGLFIWMAIDSLSFYKGILIMGSGFMLMILLHVLSILPEALYQYLRCEKLIK